jgi:glycosyltransferase involved in cell wall biosynthesis
MKILHITPTYYPATYWGGPIFSVYYLNNELAKFPTVNLDVLTTDSAGPQKNDVLDVEKLDSKLYNYKVHFTHRNFGKSFSFEMIRKMFSLIQKAEIVHLTGVYSPPTIPTLILSRILRKPLVWSPRGAILETFEWKNARRQILKRMWNRVCNFFIAPGKVILQVTSQEEQIASLASLPKAQAIIIKNGVPVLQSLPQHEWLPNGNTRLLFIGRIHPKKGIENLLDAIKLLNDSSFILKIYGTGEQKYINELKQHASGLGLLNSSVFFMGHVDGDEKQNAFLNADICVIPSHSENFGIVIAESLAHGVPVIASRQTPWQKMEEKDCGLWVKNDLASLVQAIQKIRSMDIEEMGENGWLWMKDEFGWEKIAQKTYTTYQEILKGNYDD